MVGHWPKNECMENGQWPIDSFTPDLGVGVGGMGTGAEEGKRRME